MAPHDVIVDKEGIVWFGNFGEQKLGRLDPKTGKVSEFPYAMHRDNAPTGSLGLRADGAGNMWFGNMYQATIVKFDPKAEQFNFWTLPPEGNIPAAQVNMVSPQHSDIDGKVWTQNNGFAGVHRLDIASGTTSTTSFRTPTTTPSSPISARARSAASTPKPARSRCSRRRRPSRRRGAATWMRRTGSGSANIAATG